MSQPPTSFHDLSARRIDGTDEALSSYKGKVVLVVNVASACGFTPQYDGLEKLSRELAPKGFAVLGFPSNDFGAQEPGSNAEVDTFCRSTYGVDFPMFQKVATSGTEASEVYQFLATQGGGAPKWNFHKYVVGKDGRVIASFPSSVAPESLELRTVIDRALQS